MLPNAYASIRDHSQKLTKEQLEQGAECDHLLGWQSACRELLELRNQVAELVAAAQFMVDHMYAEGMLPHGTFTLPNGETWEARGNV